MNSRIIDILLEEAITYLGKKDFSKYEERLRDTKTIFSSLPPEEKIDNYYKMFNSLIDARREATKALGIKASNEEKARVFSRIESVMEFLENETRSTLIANPMLKLPAGIQQKKVIAKYVESKAFDCSAAKDIIETSDDPLLIAKALSKCNVDLTCDNVDRILRAGNTITLSALAEHGSVPQECACGTFNELASSDNSRIEGIVAQSKRIPESCGCMVFGLLAMDGDIHTKRNIAANDSLPKDCECDILERLVDERDYFINKNIVERTKAPCKEVLETLSHNWLEEIKTKAKKRL